MAYGDYVYDEPFESGRFRSSFQMPEASNYNTWQGSVAGSDPIISGMIGFIEGFANAKAFRQSERALKKAAGQAMEQGTGLAGDVLHEGAEVKGAMTAAFGKSGTLLEGSPLLALADAQSEIEQNVARVLEQARIERESLLFQAAQQKRAGYMSKVGGIAKLVGNWGTAIAGGG